MQSLVITSLLRRNPRSPGCRHSSALIFASCRPYEFSGQRAVEIKNIVGGRWKCVSELDELVDPWIGERFMRVLNTSPSEESPEAFSQNLKSCPKCHNPFKKPERYLLYGNVPSKVAHALRQLKVADIFTRLVQRVSPKSYDQHEAQISATKRFLEIFSGDQSQIQDCGRILQSEDLNVGTSGLIEKPSMKGCKRLKRGTSEVQSRSTEDNATVSLDAVRGVMRQQNPEISFHKGGGKVRTRLTTSYVVQMLQLHKDPTLALSFFNWAGRQKGYKHSSTTYIVLIKIMSPHRMSIQLKNLKKQVEFKGLRSSTGLLKAFAAAFSQGGLVEETIDCLNQLEQLGYPPRSPLYNTVIHTLVEAGYLDGAHLLYRRMVDAGCRPNSYTFNNLLNGYGRSSNLLGMNRVFEEMKQQSCEPTVVTIGIILNVLCKAGELDEAWNVFASHKNIANLVVYNTMLHGLCKVGHIEQALDLFEEMKKKMLRLQTATFNILIHGLGLGNRIKDVIQLFESMADYDVVPDVLTYNVTLRVLAKRGWFHEASRIFADMAKRNVGPDVVTYGTLIEGFCKIGDLDSACELFCTMQASGLVSKTFTYPDAPYREKRVDDVGSVSHASRSSGCLSAKVVCTTLCTYLLRAGRLDGAQELFGEIAEVDPGFYLRAYNAAIHGLGKSGDIDKAWKLFQSMVGHGCKPDVVTYNTLISFLGKSNEVDRACELFLYMQVSGHKPDVVTCTTLVDALCKSGRTERALHLFEEMHDQGISPNVITYHSLFDGLCKEGQLPRAHVLYKRMIAEGCLPNEVMYRSLIRQFSSCRHLVIDSYRLYKEMIEKGYPCDSLTLYILTRSLRKAGKTDEALVVLSKLQPKRDRLTF